MALTAQMQVNQFLYSPSSNPREKIKVEEYIKKPLIAETQITIEPIKEKPKTKSSGAIQIGGYNPLNCVLYAQWRGMITKGYGATKNYPVYMSEPAVNTAVKLNEGPLGHISWVVEVTDDSIVIEESNFRAFNTRRTLARNDSRIIGYLH